ncbi:MAG: hypothetical protein MI725_12565 [Pirellulales bacterium]|nr:hypothetical protein [Pirellulales bacterium]
MRWVVGLLLIVAALLKGVQVYLYPADALANNVLGVNESRVLLPLQISGEFGLGLAAICGLFWRQLRWFALAVFASFSCYSLLLALQGATSCGCFGQLKIHPWWTFIIDSIVFIGLVLECFMTRQREQASVARVELSTRIGLASIITISLFIALGLAWHLAPRQASSKFALQTVGDLIILDPSSWIGEKFPLLEHIDIDVSQGRWVLLMHRRDCPKCLEAVPKYERLAMVDNECQVALIEVPPHDTQSAAQAKRCLVTRLSDEHEWFVETPIEIQMSDGVVVNASADLPLTLIGATFGITITHADQSRLASK